MPGINNLLRRFGRQVRIFRKQKMLSIEEMAGMIGISEDDVKDMETGTFDPKLSTIVLISGILDISPQDLLTFPIKDDNKHDALRYHFLKHLNNMSDDEIKKLMQISNSLHY